MRKINSIDEIKSFLDLHKIDCLNLIGYLRNHPNEHTVWVNDGDEIRGVVLYGEETHYCIINCYDDAFLDEAYRDIFKGNQVFFSGIRMELALKLQKFGKSQKKGDITDSCYLYYYPHLTIGDINPNVRPLTVEDAPIIDYFYTYRSSNSLATIKNDILSRPAVGLEIDGELAAWTLVHPDNSNGMLFVKPQFRKNNYGAVVGRSITQAVLDRGDIPYVHIVHGNDVSIHLTEGMGYVYAYRVMWFDCDFT